MKVLSLFDGISCGQLALERTGIKVEEYYASEIDKYAISVTQKNYPNTVQLGDICNVEYKNGNIISSNGTFKTEIDLIIGGSPCQGFTFAGERLEFNDPRSKLFFEYARLIKEVQPKYFLLENVKMKKESEDVITRYLGVKPLVINSNIVSAQNRHRLYWTNIPVTELENKNLLLKDIVRAEDFGNYKLSKKHHQAFLKSYKWKHCELNEKSKPLLASYYKQPPHCPYIKDDLSESGYRMLSPVECERLQTLPDNYTEGISKTQRYKCIGNGWTVDVIAHILKGLK
jgi:DNA-cytosine methyltransferase